ncbi:hypothetical protein F0562_028700 [Nyssa sinensis]|uniref:Protein kinase domain-containing protein n=1 Tax=Nyssa sinensis TaxID=561372 RepID=A0A5J5B2Z8_9ASTE|nr:hypothetical protein F0562_028700 [Nyssa sinensis]
MKGKRSGSLICICELLSHLSSSTVGETWKNRDFPRLSLSHFLPPEEILHCSRLIGIPDFGHSRCLFAMQTNEDGMYQKPFSLR